MLIYQRVYCKIWFSDPIHVTHRDVQHWFTMIFTMFESSTPINAPWCWHIYQHLPPKWPSVVGKYYSTMEHIGYIWIYDQLQSDISEAPKLGRFRSCRCRGQSLGLWGAGIGWFKSLGGALDSNEQGLVCISQVWFMMLAMMNVWLYSSY